MTFGVDYAWGRPGVAALKAAGVRFVCRYLSHDSTGKNLDRTEADELSAAGIDIVVVWESTASRALDGHAAGAQDARDAEAQAHACGMPADRPVYLAVDFDATGQTGAVNTYLDGAASVLGVDRVGIYGGYAAVHSALNGGHAKWSWQTYAWSGGQWDPRNHIEQYSNDHIIGGVGLDYDRAMKTDFGQWRVGVSPSPTPTPQTEDDMPMGHLNMQPAGPKGKINTPISFKPGQYKFIGFVVDDGYLELGGPVEIRAAQYVDADNWLVEKTLTLSATLKKVTMAIDPKAEGLSISYVGKVAPVAWDMS